jgi:hypothetical protein
MCFHENQTGGSEGLEILIRNKKCAKIFLFELKSNVVETCSFCITTGDNTDDDTGACETLVSCPAVIWVTAQDDFGALITCEGFKS